MNTSVLMVFSLLFFTLTISHADHLVDHVSHIEQQSCYICHQGIDTPPEFPQVKTFNNARYYLQVKAVVTAPCQIHYYVQPPLRAPPVIS